MAKKVLKITGNARALERFVHEQRFRFRKEGFVSEITDEPQTETVEAETPIEDTKEVEVADTKEVEVEDTKAAPAEDKKEVINEDKKEAKPKKSKKKTDEE